MSALAVGTIVSKRFLALARVLAQSFSARHPEIPFYVLLTDEVDGCFDPDSEPFRWLELSDRRGLSHSRLCWNYTEQELMYALTPDFLQTLLGQGYRQVVFFKQESLVTGGLSPIFTALNDCSILLAPHLLSPLNGKAGMQRELNILLSGVFNVGCLGVSDSPTAQRFLEWWGDRLQEHCRHDVAQGMHFEQRWLDLVPAYFEDVKLLRDPGINVGHWNLPERKVEWAGSQFTVDGHPCRFVRFSGYDPACPTSPTRYNFRLNSKNIGPIWRLFEQYQTALTAAGHWECQSWPYSYSRFDNGIPIPAVARELLQKMGKAGQRFGNPFQTSQPGNYYEWLNSPVAEMSCLSNLFREIYHLRVDVRTVFPDVGGGDRSDFLLWLKQFGQQEYRLPDAFLLPLAGAA